eukprot:1969164-Alexandrium_andersonii.AAC.1
MLPLAASPRRCARAVSPPNRGRGRSAGTSWAGSHAPSISRGGTPVAGPQGRGGRGPSACRATRGGQHYTPAGGPDRMTSRPNRGPCWPLPRRLARGPWAAMLLHLPPPRPQTPAHLRRCALSTGSGPRRAKTRTRA